MSRRLLLPALLILLLLAGCAPSEETVPDGSGSAGVPEAASSAPERPELLPAARLQADLDGDGADETVELYQDSQESPETADQLSHWYVETEVGDQPAVCDLNEGYSGYDLEQAPVFFSFADRQGRPLVAVGLVPEGGGDPSGGLEVYVLAWGEDGFSSLTVPRYSIHGVRDGMTAQVTVMETGNSEELNLDWWLSLRQQEAVLGEDGTVVWPVAPAYYIDYDGIYRIIPAQPGVRLVQVICGQSASDWMGFLVTQVTWDQGEPMLLDQYFDWQSKSLDEVCAAISAF